ncbi:MAG: NAD-dependent epimerase/dehydratase family protein [Nitrososphaerota archaeon]|nr:NAD-dependent epimerase/dehydratase family protein [Nitrososphaerota archaeon]
MRGHALVTGGAGFIGSHVVDLLLRKGYTVTVVDDLSAGRASNLPEDVELVRKDVRMLSAEDVKDAELVVHCAAQVSTFKSVDYPEEDFARNAEGTFRVLEVLRKHNPRALFIYTSSRSVHGDIPKPHVAEESWPYNPSTFYNVHKIYGEMLCKIYGQLYGIRHVILRPSNVYGPRQPYWAGGWYNFIAYWFELAVRIRPIPIYGTGQQVRDYTFVEDTARAYVLASEVPEAVGETFLLPTGVGTTLNQLAEKVLEITGSRAGVEYFPPRKGDIMRFVGSYRKAEEKLGWRPTVHLDEGLRREYEWIRAEIGGK